MPTNKKPTPTQKNIHIFRMLAFVDDLRQLDWGTAFEFPEVAYSDMSKIVKII